MSLRSRAVGLVWMIVAATAWSSGCEARDLDEASTTELCDALEQLADAAALPNRAAAETYGDLAEKIDAVIEDAPSASMAEKARVNRLRALASGARLVSLQAAAGDDAKRRTAEGDLAETAAKVEDC